MGRINNYLNLLRILLSSPAEFMDRVEDMLIYRFEQIFPRKGDYNPVSFDEAVKQVCLLLKAEINWEEIQEVEKIIIEKMKFIELKKPFPIEHNADFTLALMCFAICRIIKPEVVIETGVAYGVTSTYILKALELNNRGVLHSIDLPPLGKNSDSYVGWFVPEELKRRWCLHRGASKRILPSLLPQVKSVDIFIHDSRHTYQNIKRELSLVLPYLSRRSVVIADDVQENRAFLEWAAFASPSLCLTFTEEQKDALTGIAVFI